MSTSVRVTLLPSITLQSLQSLDQFLPCMSLPVARVSPWMAKRLNASSRAVSSTGVEEPMPPSLVPFESDESLLDARSLDWSECGRKGTGLMLGCLAIWTLKSSALSLDKTAQHHLQTVMFLSSKQNWGCENSFRLVNLPPSSSSYQQSSAPSNRLIKKLTTVMCNTCTYSHLKPKAKRRPTRLMSGPDWALQNAFYDTTSLFSFVCFTWFRYLDLISVL